MNTTMVTWQDVLGDEQRTEVYTDELTEFVSDIAGSNGIVLEFHDVTE